MVEMTMEIMLMVEAVTDVVEGFMGNGAYING